MSRTETAEGYASSYDTLAPASLPGRESSRTSLLDLPPVGGGGRSVAAGAGAVLVHAGVVILALTVGAQVTRRVAQLEVSKLIEVDLPAPIEEPPEPEPVEEPPPQVKQAALAPPPESDEPVDPSTETEAEPPPAPAESGEVLTADDEIVDFGETIISGKGATFAGGLSSADGTSKAAVRTTNARVGGVLGGTGSGKPVRAAPPVDLSRSPQLAGGMQWNCPFPPEADMEQIDEAAVSLQVQVAPNGNVQEIAVLSDPGYGFGREARRCAQRKRWDPGFDKMGKPIGATARIKVRFQR